MDFEKAYENYKNGTACDEEILYIEQEIARLKKLSELLQDAPVKSPAIAAADGAAIKKAKKSFTVKSIAVFTTVVIVCMMIAAGAICGGVFGTAAASAKDNIHYDGQIARTMALDYAKNYASQSLGIADTDGAVITEWERELRLDTALTRSVYVYNIEVNIAGIAEIDLVMNSKSGYIEIDDIERY